MLNHRLLANIEQFGELQRVVWLLHQPFEDLASSGVLEYRKRLVEIDHLLPNLRLGSGGLLKTQLEHRIISVELVKLSWEPARPYLSQY